jgi:LacI family transcriptional regulator
MAQRLHSSRRRVVVVVDSFAESVQRAIAYAVSRHATFEAEWSPLFLELRLAFSDAEYAIKKWAPDGILCWRWEPWLAKPARDTPFVMLSSSIPDQFEGFVCGNDDMALGGMAADFFIERGYRRLGIFGSIDQNTRLRRDGFLRRVDRAGLTCGQCLYERKVGREWNYEQRIDMARQWLQSMRPPVGVFLVADGQASRVAEACRDLGLRIPEDVALLGAGNDELSCNLVRPTLSSIELDGQRIGSEASRLLDRLMNAEAKPAHPLLIRPLKVIERGSTDSLAIEDEPVVRAKRFLRDHLGEAIGMDDLAKYVNLSRRSIERRFARWVGRSPGEELRRLRIDQAKRLLLETQIPIAEVAIRCGYRRPERLSAHFHQATGQSPRDFRGR